MTHRIYSFRTLTDKVCEATFFNGEVRRLDMKPLINAGMEYADLSSEELFKMGETKSSGAKVVWNTDITVDSDDFYNNSIFIETIPIRDVRIRLAHVFMYARELSNMSQAELAAKVGIDQSDISKIERGVANPSIMTIDKLARGMGEVINFDFAEGYYGGNAEPMLEELKPYLNPAKQQGDFTIADLLMMDELAEAGDKDIPFRVELMDGVLYRRNNPTLDHQRIIGEVFFQVRAFIENNGGSCEPLMNPGVGSDQDITSAKDYLIPDFAINCDPERSGNAEYIVRAPEFILEVISPSTASHDKGYKRLKYAELGTREYWLIDPQKKNLVVYNYMEEDCIPKLYPLSGKAPVAIYNGRLEIDLDRIAKVLKG